MVNVVRRSMPALDADKLKSLIEKKEAEKAALVVKNREKSAELRAMQENEQNRTNDERLASDTVKGRIAACDDLVKDGMLSQQEADERKSGLVKEQSRIKEEGALAKRVFEVKAETLAEEVNGIRADIRDIDGRLKQYREMLTECEQEAHAA